MIKVSNEIKKGFSEIPIVGLSHYPKELQIFLNKETKRNIDFVFHWNGNVGIFLAIIKVTPITDNMLK